VVTVTRRAAGRYLRVRRGRASVGEGSEHQRRRRHDLGGVIAIVLFVVLISVIEGVRSDVSSILLAAVALGTMLISALAWFLSPDTHPHRHRGSTYRPRSS
jgi:hypothetical protein